MSGLNSAMVRMEASIGILMLILRKRAFDRAALSSNEEFVQIESRRWIGVGNWDLDRNESKLNSTYLMTMIGIVFLLENCYWRLFL